jgi:hypothetical protein
VGIWDEEKRNIDETMERREAEAAAAAEGCGWGVWNKCNGFLREDLFVPSIQAT